MDWIVEEEKGEIKMLVSYTFEIEEKTKDKIEKFAKDESRSLAAQIRIALDNYAENLK